MLCFLSLYIYNICVNIRFCLFSDRRTFGSSVRRFKMSRNNNMAGSANNAPLGHMRRPLSIGGAGAGGIGGGSLLNPTYMSGNAGRNMNNVICIRYN